MVYRTTAQAVGIRSANRVGRYRIARSEQFAIKICPKGRTLFVVGDTNQHQFTGADLDILQPRIEAMLVKASHVRCGNIVIQAAQVGEPEFADTDIDILDTGAIPGHIEPEVIL